MFSKRSYEKELLDGEDIPAPDLYQNLKELNAINNILGGYHITRSALDKVLHPKQTYTLVDIGSGGGDTLKYIHRWQKKRGWQLRLFGIDLKPVCIEYAQQNAPNAEITFYCDDYRNMSKHIPKVDIVHACLFCHHLSESQIVDLIRFTKAHGSILIVNDLERNPIAYYAIKWLTALFSKSYLVKNDAPLSVARGFKKREWLAMIQEAGATRYSVKNKWAFRHEIIVYA